MKVFSVPVPAFVAAALPQLPEGLSQSTPGWVTNIILAAWVLGWLLDKLGKLPGSTSGPGPALDPEDVVELVMTSKVGERGKTLVDAIETITREDKDKPGWPMVWNSSEAEREIRSTLKELVEAQRDTNRLLELSIERRGEPRE